jgi:predicted outer membrane repeat protein
MLLDLVRARWVLVASLPLAVACAPSLDSESKDGSSPSDPNGTDVTEPDIDGDDDGGDDSGDDGTTGPVDADGDGFTDDEDCDDTDTDINPDAEEVFDGEDNDCDGYVDEIEVCEDGVGVLQEAIDDAPDGATLLLCAGEWNENLELSRRELTIIGLEGASETTVNGGGTGRAMLVTNSELVVQGLTLANGADTNGGVAFCSGSELTLIESVLRDGVAEDGAGLSANNCELAIESTTFSNNVASRYGGGLYTTGTTGDVVDSVIDGNVALEGGGAFTYDGEVNFLRTTISANEATTVDEEAWGPGGGGGGLWSAGGEIRESNIVGNISAYQAGGAYFYRGRPEFVDNTVDGNYCAEDGGGIYFNISTAVVEGNVFRNNEAADDAGGLRFYYGNSRVESNEFYDNSAGDDGGGAKFSHSEHEFLSNYMEGNSTGDAGGGLELDNDSTYVTDSVFINNSAGRGAGLHNWRTEARFTIENSEFIGNTASDCGGGLQFDNSPYRITVRDLWLEGNEAGDGAALCVDRVYRDPEDVGGEENYYQDTLLAIENLIMTDNEAGDDGGAMYVRAGEVNIENVVLDGNEGPDAGAMSVKGGTVTITNTIISNNSGGPALYVEDTEDGPGSITVTYSNLYGNSSVVSGLDDPRGTAGNMDENPDFDNSAGDFSLRSSSPCIDAGSPDIRDSDGSRSDMGAYGGPGAP